MDCRMSLMEKFRDNLARTYALGDSDLCHFVDFKAGFDAGVAIVVDEVNKINREFIRREASTLVLIEEQKYE